MTASWAARWDALLDRGDTNNARELAQGRAYHRSGRVTNLRVGTGVLRGRVQGARATPRAVEVTVAVLDEAQWARVVSLLAGELRHSARLLAGLQPEGLEEELSSRGVRLLPEPDEIDTTCGCGRAQPCAHAAALWQTVTERIAEDPFTLLRLRGRGRERLLAELAAERAEPAEAAFLALEGLQADGWTRARSPLGALHLPPEAESGAPFSPLRLLENPPGWPPGPDPETMFRPLVERAALWASALREGRETNP